MLIHQDVSFALAVRMAVALSVLAYGVAVEMQEAQIAPPPNPALGGWRM